MKLFLKRKLEESQAAAVTCRTNKLCYFVQKCKYFEEKKKYSIKIVIDQMLSDSAAVRCSLSNVNRDVTIWSQCYQTWLQRWNNQNLHLKRVFFYVSSSLNCGLCRFFNGTFSLRREFQLWLLETLGVMEIPFALHYIVASLFLQSGFLFVCFVWVFFFFFFA